jgi:hypothetical protein
MLFLQGENSAQKIKTGWGGVDWEFLKISLCFLSLLEILSLNFSHYLYNNFSRPWESSSEKTFPNPPSSPHSTKNYKLFIHIIFIWIIKKKKKISRVIVCTFVAFISTSVKRPLC